MIGICKICEHPIENTYDPNADVCATKNCGEHSALILHVCDDLDGLITGTHGDPYCGQMLKLYNFIKYKVDKWVELDPTDSHYNYDNAVLSICKASMLQYEERYKQFEKHWIDRLLSETMLNEIIDDKLGHDFIEFDCQDLMTSYKAYCCTKCNAVVTRNTNMASFTYPTSNTLHGPWYNLKTTPIMNCADVIIKNIIE